MFDGRLSCMCVQSWPLDVVCTGLWSAGSRLRRKRVNPTRRLRLELFFVLRLFERGFFCRFTLGLELATWCALASLAKCAEDLKIPNVHFSLHGVSRLVWFQILLCESPAVCMCSQKESLDLESLVQKFQKDAFCSLQPFYQFLPPCLPRLFDILDRRRQSIWSFANTEDTR